MSETKIPTKLKVGIAGAGGIGSHLASMLFDYGANRNQFPFTDYQIDIFDDDTVDFKNLLHQNYKEEDIGNLKVNSLADRYALNAVPRYMTTEDFSKYDVIFCGVDSMTFRKALYEWSWANPTSKTFWIDGRCTSRQGAIFNKTTPRADLEKMLNDSTERGGCLLAYEKEQNIAHALPVIVAGMMIQTFLNYLRGNKPFASKLFMI